MLTDSATEWLPPAIGWLSSAVLFATTIKQLKTQWDSGSTQGVSRWLFIGQCVSSIGFAVYSALVRNWVFTITNSVLVLSALVGCWIGYWLRKHPRKGNAVSD